MSGVSVIIVTCGVRGFLRACLDSVHRQSSPVREVIVIDNSLDPGLRARLGDCLSGVNLVSNARNQPYGVSLNQGIRISSGEFILCLNDDVTLEPGYVGEALKGFSAGGRVGMVSGKILRPDRKTIDSTGLFLTMYRTAKERGYGLPDLGQYQSAGPVFGVSGAAAFYRRSMLFDVADRGGFFDPDFGMFYEDLDIAWRAHRRGWKG
ncbi:MAG: glycosyltransferase [Deltaproteobacteria bacterium]